MTGWYWEGEKFWSNIVVAFRFCGKLKLGKFPLFINILLAHVWKKMDVIPLIQTENSETHLY